MSKEQHTPLNALVALMITTAVLRDIEQMERDGVLELVVGGYRTVGRRRDPRATAANYETQRPATSATAEAQTALIRGLWLP